MRLARAGRILLSGAIGLAALYGLAYGIAVTQTDRSGLARSIAWGDADVDDYTRFPSRAVPASGTAYLYEKAEGYPEGLPAPIGLPGGRKLDDLLTGSETTAFLVIKDDRLVYERYFNGSEHDAVQTSFSVAKSFASALLGAAIADGAIAGVDDPVTKYLPELLKGDPRFAEIAIRHLVTMSSGLHYEEYGVPWSDDALTYYDPDLRDLALRKARIEEAPGLRFHYNNYNPLLLGMILERATGQSVADYLSEKIWKPVGAEADASWSIDSMKDGFEKMESGINARAVDFAKLGSLYLHRGTFNGKQILPAEWIDASTTPALPTGYAFSSGYGRWWWTHEAEGLGSYYSARGNKGQFVFVFPSKGLVVTRHGRDYGGVDWSGVAEAVARAF